MCAGTIAFSGTRWNEKVTYGVATISTVTNAGIAKASQRRSGLSGGRTPAA